VQGQEIETTAEHPFWVPNRCAWVPAGELEPGDYVQTRDRRWLPVEEVTDTGRVEQLYNFRVADYHTYFVGSEDWGFSAWAHNQYVKMSDVADLTGIKKEGQLRYIAGELNSGVQSRIQAVRLRLQNQGADPRVVDVLLARSASRNGGRRQVANEVNTDRAARPREEMYVGGRTSRDELIATPEEIAASLNRPDPDDVTFHFADLARARSDFNREYPRIAAIRTGDVTVDGVVTKFILGDHEFYGRNNWAGHDAIGVENFKQAGFRKPGHPDVLASNTATANHGEGHVFFQAWNANGRQRMNGGRATLYVSHEFCPPCASNSGVRALMRALGIRELQTYRQNGPGTNPGYIAELIQL
jgi:intein/homing endonuclease